VVDFALHFASRERRAYIEEHIDVYGYRWALRQLPSHVVQAFCCRPVTGAFTAVVAVGGVTTGFLALVEKRWTGLVITVALFVYAAALAYFDTPAASIRRAVALALGALVLAAASGWGAFRHHERGAADLVLSLGLGLQALGMAAVAAIASLCWFRALRPATVLAVAGAALCGIADFEAGRHALVQGDPLLAATLFGITVLASFAVFTVPRFDVIPPRRLVETAPD
jgi:hypothetical protein